MFNAVADYPKLVAAAIDGFAGGVGCLVPLGHELLRTVDRAELGLP